MEASENFSKPSWKKTFSIHKLLLFLKTKIMYNTYLYICILEKKEEEKSVI